jgi:4-diphosphocytidyl-2-C-methyl-D-erythritol kinase
VTARAARVVAQAKINLGLRILARERSGFHGIETIFARLALGDEVTVHAGGRDRVVECRGADTGPVERNLAYRAAVVFGEAAGWPSGFRIDIEKRIPVGSGLGGGSADAGAVLRALNALAPSPLSDDHLLRIAGSLGSDVPFLASTAPLALAWGRGERMLRLTPLPERHVLLVFPNFSVATSDAYAWVAESRGDYEPSPRLIDSESLTTWEALRPLSENDFEPIVAQRYPRITTIVDRLRAGGASIARLTGSGSTVYGIFAHAPELAALALSEQLELTNTITGVAPVEVVG